MAVTENNTALVIPVDAEHSGLRIVIVALFIASWVIGYIGVNLLIPGGGINLLAIFLSFLLAYLLVNQVERVLKTRWRSGRTLQIDERGVRLMLQGNLQQEIRADEPASVLMWQFQTPRRSRIPKGWHVIACAIEQDDLTLPIYAFMSPDQFKNFEWAKHFAVLKSQKEMKKGGNGRDALLLAGEQRRLHQAENRRWVDGAEMTVQDFESYLARLKERFPDWMASV